MTRKEIEDILTAEGKAVICDVIVRLMTKGEIDITDINACKITTPTGKRVCEYVLSN